MAGLPPPPAPTTLSKYEQNVIFEPRGTYRPAATQILVINPQDRLQNRETVVQLVIAPYAETHGSAGDAESEGHGHTGRWHRRVRL
jgi:hypothetical protein